MAALRTLQISSQLLRYDISMPLFDGRVAIDGFELKPVKASAMVFDDNPELREGRFDLWEINMGYFNPAIEQGWELIGLPIFPKRKPVYQYIFSRTDSGIDSPKDLEGKRIGTLQYRIVIDIYMASTCRDCTGLSSARTFFPF
jgi:4,5-dihydroxyphthalate decarboxylase